MSDHPTLKQQIEAVEWAARHIDGAWLQPPVEDLRHRLEAAVETLKMLEFAQEALG